VPLPDPRELLHFHQQRGSEMTEKRKQTRRIAREKYDLFDTNSGEHMGVLVNMTTEGMMLFSHAPISPDSVFQLEMRLPRPFHDAERIAFGAEALWCMRASENGHYWTGFRIIDIADETETLLAEMIAGWSPEALSAA